jgi:hypothetical protein
MAHPLVVYLAGASSATGQAESIFRDLISYLVVAGDYVRDDFVEASYRVAPDGAPLPYTPDDSVAPLVASTATIARYLEWQRRQTARRLCLLGWSLGGVLFFDALAALLRADPTWSDSVRALVTLASPLLGSDVDGLDLLGGLAAGAAGADLARRAADSAEQQRVRDDAAHLRQSGIRLVTLAAAEDAIVTPADALLPSLGPTPDAFVLQPRRRVGASYLDGVLGHNALPHDPVCWRQVFDALGPADQPHRAP